MNTKILLIVSLIISVNMQGATTESISRGCAATPENIHPSLLVLIRTGLVPCPNPNCSKKKDKEPKTVKKPGLVYHAGFSHGESCEVCGDKRDINYFAN